MSKMYQHTLVIGGSGMLANCTIGLSRVSQAVSVVGREARRLLAVGDRCHGAFEPLAVDYRNSAKLTEAVDTAIRRHGPIDLVVAWIHLDAPEASGAVAALAMESNSAVIYVDVVGSAFADPAAPGRLRARQKLIQETGVEDYRSVVLGYVAEPSGSRWLSNEEISSGVLAAVVSESRSMVVGAVDPWHARPGC